MALTKICAHHEIPSWELVKKIMEVSNDNERSMSNTNNRGTLVKNFTDKSMKFTGMLVENWPYRKSSSNNGRI